MFYKKKIFNSSNLECDHMSRIIIANLVLRQKEVSKLHTELLTKGIWSSTTLLFSFNTKKIAENVRMWQKVTHQYAAGGGLSRDKFSCPILGFCHKSTFEFLFSLSGELLLLLLGVVGSILRLLSTAEEGKSAPYQHAEEAHEERADAG